MSNQDTLLREILRLIDGLYLAFEYMNRGEKLKIDLGEINEKMAQLYALLPPEETK